jgi:hypothetical protein
MIPELEIQHTGTEEVERLQENVKKFVKVLEDNPLLDGHLLDRVFFTGAATVVINHGLGRQIRGWIVVDKFGSAGGPPFETVERTAWDDKTLTLTATGTCCVLLWVF